MATPTELRHKHTFDLRVHCALMGVSVRASTETQRAGTEPPALVHCVVALASCRRGPATHTAHAVSMRIEQRTGAWRQPRLPGRPGSSALACGGPPATISCGLLEGRSRGLMPASPVSCEAKRTTQCTALLRYPVGCMHVVS